MPELPEVEVILRQLQSQILGDTIKSFHVRRSDIIRRGFSSHEWYVGATLTHIMRKGKSLILTCEKSQSTRYIIAELGMTGLFLFQQASMGYDKHIHLTFILGDSSETALHYWNPRRFGRVYLFDTKGVRQFVKVDSAPILSLSHNKSFMHSSTKVGDV